MRSTNKLVGVLAALGLLVQAGPAAPQESAYHDEMAAKIESKREEIRRHTEAMEAIDDPAALQREMQSHFRMTEELLGWVLEHQKQRLANAGPTETSTAPAAGQVDQSTTSMAPGMGMGGCKGEGCGKGMEMGGKGMGKGMDMSGKGMGGMGHGGTMKGGMEEHGGGEHGGHGMGSMASPSEPSGVAGASAAAARIAEREALLREITTHSLYLEGVVDPEERARETLKHQQMLDRLMGLMQE